MSPIKTVLVIVAMEAEAAPIIERLGLVKESTSKLAGPAPVTIFSGDYNGGRVIIACNGKDPVTGVDNVGTTAATLSAYLALDAYKPDLVISAGTAGGFKARGGNIGDVYVGTSVLNHDRRIPIPGFDVYGIGKYECVSTDRLREALGLKGGPVTSGNSLGWTADDMTIMTEHGACAKEMEAAAIGWVCDQYKTPFTAVKAITDIVDGDRPTQEEFLENLTAAANALQSAVPKVIDFVLGKDISSL